MENLNVVTLNDEQCFLISKRASGLPYKADSKLSGQTFSRFAYEGKVFSVNDNLGFEEALTAQDLKTVTLIKRNFVREVIADDGTATKVDDYTWDLDTFIKESDVMNREIRRAKHKAQVGVIQRVAESDKLDADSLKAILSVTV